MRSVFFCHRLLGAIAPNCISTVQSSFNLMSLGLKNADALHLACASAVDCDWFLTVDKGILKKVREYKTTRVANPVEFIMENEYGND